MSVSNSAGEKPHKKARTSPYPGSQVERSQVSNEKVSWLAEWPEYKLVKYTSVSQIAEYHIQSLCVPSKVVSYADVVCLPTYTYKPLSF
ncbi:hypothetical protein E5288_WYG009237 [Bos mutus]|uniref:Uncharacterized protein n=1 Tax=Bos mutus TaxID=72004 RepID=A0A6B0QW33_9CETA|nr:hypothetical protein [Bos mutus]